MNIVTLCSRRSIALRLAAASDNAGLNWPITQFNLTLFRERVAVEKPRFVLVANEHLEDPSLFTTIRESSPQTAIIVCLTPDTDTSLCLWTMLDHLEFDVLCTVDELTDCLLTLKAGRFYQSSLLQTHSVVIAREMLPGWQCLTAAERRVLKLIADDKSGPQIANSLCLSERTINNHKARISQKLNIGGGPGSLTRYVLANRNQIQKLLD
ncbi:hypothetical protein GCM10027578_39160 [Spirosoma luteolum]